MPKEETAMAQTLGERIARLRKEKGLTQEELAEKLNVTPQAVSKWENGQSCPDITLLPTLAELLNVTTDILLSGEKAAAMQVLPPEKRKNIDEMMLRIYVYVQGEEEVRVTFPFMLCKIMLESGLQPDLMLSGNMQGMEAMKGVDLQKLFLMVENGCIGTLMEVHTQDGTDVRIVVE